VADNRLAVKTIKNSMLNIVSFLVGLGVNFYLLRFVVGQIGIESYGISALLLVIVAPLTLANLGFGEATTKYVAEYVHAGDYQQAGAFIRTTFFMNLMIGLIGCVLIFFFGGPVASYIFSSQISHSHDELISNCMKVIAFGWLINQCSGTFLGVPVALQKFSNVAVGNLIFVVSGAIYTYLLLINGYGLLGFTIATVASQFTAMLFWYFTAQRLMKGVSLAPRLDKIAWKRSFHYGGWQTISQIGGILSQQTEKYIIGILLATASVGTYNVVMNIQQKIYTIVHKFAEVLFPLFSALSNDDEARRANILLKSTWILTTLAVSMLVSTAPLAHDLIKLWLKNDYVADQGSIVLQIACFGGAFGSATTAGFFFLLGIGKTKKITYISILTGVVTIVAAVIVLPLYGLAGAGWSYLISMVVQSGAIVRIMRTTLKNVTPLKAIFVAIYAPIITGSIVSLAYIKYVRFPVTGWLSLGGSYMVVFVSVAGSILLVTRYLPHGKEHLQLMKSVLTQTLGKVLLRLKDTK
jgi:O-antigen/teichoic acid export membrane protein